MRRRLLTFQCTGPARKAAQSGDFQRWGLTMRGLLGALLLATLLSACTFLYIREYEIDSPPEMFLAEKQAVFSAFRDFLVSKGLSPLSYGEKTDPNRVAFRIGGSTAGFALRRDFEDILELVHSEKNGFRLRLVRIVHQRANFSDEYIMHFVKQTEKSILDATSKPIRIKLVPPVSPQPINPPDAAR